MLGFRDAALARQLEEIFERDRRDCVELELEAWNRRGFWHRLKDNAYYAFNEVM
jgi:cardiolipin synthase